MDILIQSFLGIAERLNSSIHIRYLARKGQPMDPTGNGEGAESAAQGAGNGKKTSYVIIRQAYSYLEPVVHSMFEGSEDIKVVVDRRFSERRQAALQGVPNRRNIRRDRRACSPMLDILINVDP